MRNFPFESLTSSSILSPVLQRQFDSLHTHTRTATRTERTTMHNTSFVVIIIREQQSASFASSHLRHTALLFCCLLLSLSQSFSLFTLLLLPFHRSAVLSSGVWLKQPLGTLYKIVLKMPQHSVAPHVSHPRTPPLGHAHSYRMKHFAICYFSTISPWSVRACVCVWQSRSWSLTQTRNCCSLSALDLASVSVCFAFHLTYKLPFIVERQRAWEEWGSGGVCRELLASPATPTIRLQFRTYVR